MNTFVKIFSSYGSDRIDKLESEINTVARKRNLDIVSASPCIKDFMNADAMYIVVVFKQKYTEVLTMTENEQIEEMARDLRKSEYWYFDDISVDFELNRKITAQNLYAKDYRKASEVINEIIELLTEVKEDYLSTDEIREASAVRYVIGRVEDFKKKYGGADNDGE